MSDAQHSVRRLMNEYCYAIDRGDLDGFASLFANGSFAINGDPDGPMLGSEPVRRMLDNVTLYDGKPNTKHVMSNVQIDVSEDGHSAVAECYITVFQALPPDFPLQPIFLGHYQDSFEKADGTWQFTSRRISPDLIGDLSRHRADMA
jgi:hypothetical protein